MPEIVMGSLLQTIIFLKMKLEKRDTLYLFLVPDPYVVHGPYLFDNISARTGIGIENIFEMIFGYV